MERERRALCNQGQKKHEQETALVAASLAEIAGAVPRGHRMNMATAPTLTDQELTARIGDLAREWMTLLDMRPWEIHVKVSPQFHEENRTLVAECVADWQYEYATITFYLPMVREVNAEHLEPIVVHELMHVLLAELDGHLKATGKEHKEHVATTLARVILSLRERLKRRAPEGA